MKWIVKLEISVSFNCHLMLYSLLWSIKSSHEGKQWKVMTQKESKRRKEKKIQKISKVKGEIKGYSFMPLKSTLGDSFVYEVGRGRVWGKGHILTWGLTLVEWYQGTKKHSFHFLSSLLPCSRFNLYICVWPFVLWVLVLLVFLYAFW